MKSIHPFLVFTFVIQLMMTDSSLFAQEPADTSRIFYSLEEASANPETVYHLHLIKKGLKEIPVVVFKMKNLRDLDLSKNRIRSVPKEIGMLTEIENLNLMKNMISDVSPEIGNLENLRHLNLSRNRIINMPSTIGKLKNLEDADLWDNDLNPLPDEIGELKNLKSLDLRSILFSAEEHRRLKALLPNTKVFLSPSCNCKN